MPDSSTHTKMPVLFIGHGSPMNAIEDNTWSRAMRSLGASFSTLYPKPRAIVCVSAHWYTHGTYTTGNDRPETIYDFGGFPEELYQVVYPAPGDAALAGRVANMAGNRASVQMDWGLDHGTWSVLVHLFPAADIPVIQLSMDGTLSHAKHIEIGKRIAGLRNEGMLVLGSGNIVHNLRDAFGRMNSADNHTPDWAGQFDALTATALEKNDRAWLASAPEGELGKMAHPTPDHYLPLLYCVGAADPGDTVSFPITGFDLGSLSMRSVLFSSP